MDVVSWGQLAFFAVMSTVGLIFAVSHLFKTMTNSYGGIIGALQTQNFGQQKQIDNLTEKHEDCERKHADTQRMVEDLRKRVGLIENGHRKR